MDPFPENPTMLAGRRWTPLALGALGFVLIFTLFPNPLRPPPQNPNAAAEYAPKVSQNQPAFGESGLASSGGVGVADAPDNLPPGAPPDVQARAITFRPRQKACVGIPPRQTEDPLSPPCVPFFDGDNGGATNPGVTRDEIIVLLYNDWGIDGELNTPYSPSQEPASFRINNTTVGSWTMRTLKAHIRYFQERYQTYGRVVRFVGVKSQGFGSSCEQRGGDASSSYARHHPFAAVDFSFGNTSCFTDQMAAEHHVMTFGVNWDLPPEVYRNNAPFIFGFYPDQGIEADWTASFICDTLGHGQRARWANDPELQIRKRSFGLITPSRRSEFLEDRVSDRLVAGLRQRCGITFDLTHEYGTESSFESPTTNVMAAFQGAGITTVVCVCSPDRVSQYQGAAVTRDYHPEWIFDHGNRMLRASTIRGNHEESMRGFGITHFWRARSVRSQHHYRAYASEEPGTQPNLGINFDVYHQLLNLFSGIQAAGPLLTPETVRKGMFTFNYVNQADGWLPTGGYGPYSPKAIGDYSFIDTAAAFWWDPQGHEPGRARADGCIRLVREGHRYYPGEFPRTDTVLFDPSTAPCTTDQSGGGGSL